MKQWAAGALFPILYRCILCPLSIVRDMQQRLSMTPNSSLAGFAASPLFDLLSLLSLLSPDIDSQPLGPGLASQPAC